ncbi:phosphotransferase family protein [Streptomyces sp. NPDC087440]|uniref:phosphotransferase family protein n=1 Tax=Streptomyces sp. NPDC087440 TaxID=3365790 RepID=UPI00382E6E19
MISTRVAASRAVLDEALSTAGLDAESAEPIRLAENDLWRTTDRVVARIARPGQEAAAAREVAVARWLNDEGVAAVRPLDIEQPVFAAGRATTFWEELPPHRHGDEKDLAPLLRQLHDLPIPHGLGLPELNPFVRLDERIAEAVSLGGSDRKFLLDILDELRAAWADLPPGASPCVVHADAWGGNCAVTSSRTYLLDFERVAIGRPEWDLVSTAVSVDTFGSLAEGAYLEFCASYGADVRDWPGYVTMRSVRELRLATFAAQVADHDPSAQEEAKRRVACLRGDEGARPWGWRPVG